MTAPAPKSRKEWVRAMDEIIWQYEHGGFGNWIKSRDAVLDAIMALQSEVERLSEIAFLIGNIYYYGNFKAETGNERDLEGLLIQCGYRYRTEDEVLEARKRFPYVEKAR